MKTAPPVRPDAIALPPPGTGERQQRRRDRRRLGHQQMLVVVVMVLALVVTVVVLAQQWLATGVSGPPGLPVGLASVSPATHLPHINHTQQLVSTRRMSMFQGNRR